MISLKWRKVLSLARFASFNTDTEQGRSDERHRRILMTATASGLSKVVTVGTTFISIPLTLQYLGTERFGLWMTISSVIAMLGFADLGIGNGLLSAISEANGKDDHAAIRRYISSAFAILSGIAILVLLIFYFVDPFIPWANFFNVTSPLASEEAGAAVAAVVVCFALNIPAGIIQRVQMGLQMGFVGNLWLMAESLVGLLAVLLAIHYKMGLPWLVGAMAGAPVLVAFLNSALFFGGVRPDLRPELAQVCRAAMQKVAHTGLLFLVLQIVFAVAYTSDNIVIAKILGAEAVTQYAVLAKLFGIIPLVLGMALMPLWPAYGEAISRGDGPWVKKTFYRSIKLATGFAAVAAGLLVIFANEILALWVRPGVRPTLLLLLGMALWQVTAACGNALAVFLNGANVVRAQVIIGTVTAIVAITLKIILIQSIGLPGVVFATVLSFVICTLLPFVYLVPRLLNKKDSC